LTRYTAIHTTRDKGDTVENVRATLDAAERTGYDALFSEHLTGLDFYLNANMIDADSATHIRKVLQDALKAIEKAVPQYS